MGKYFGREPRYSREELERQAQEAIEARVNLGRPPAEDWAPLQARLAELDQVMAARQLPTMPEPEPMRLHEVRMPPAPAPAPAAQGEPAKARRPVAAQGSAN
ncbi:MAG TPA: hypothetical protein VM388_03160 [Acidimicrobiales bacterium]|nr:hypothetical protein [Acidimicrobiales bacterium]